MTNKILFIDTETGGIDPNHHSLLSVGLVVWSTNGIEAVEEILLKESIFRVTHDALKINKIDIVEHAEVALDKKDGLQKLIKFVKKYFGENDVILAGHNVNFDINFIKVWFKEQNIDFSSIFSHRSLDTHSILLSLSYSSLLNPNITNSSKAFEYFDIQVEKRHSALSDAKATALLFEKLLLLLKRGEIK